MPHHAETTRISPPRRRPASARHSKRLAAAFYLVVLPIGPAAASIDDCFDPAQPLVEAPGAPAAIRMHRAGTRLCVAARTLYCPNCVAGFYHQCRAGDWQVDRAAACVATDGDEISPAASLPSPGSATATTDRAASGWAWTTVATATADGDVAPTAPAPAPPDVAPTEPVPESSPGSILPVPPRLPIAVEMLPSVDPPAAAPARPNSRAFHAAPLPPKARAARAAPPPPVDTAAPYLKRGQELLATGDLAAARLFFEHAATAGSARAAMLVGKTYDPMYYREAGVHGAPPRPEDAVRWYREAIGRGDAEAKQRLQKLEALLPQK